VNNTGYRHPKVMQAVAKQSERFTHACFNVARFEGYIRLTELFGALDAMTRERLNVGLHRIWRESGKTILFVTHSISEAVFLATQIVVLTARPARMAARIPIALKEPRTLAGKTDVEFAAYTRRVYELLRMV
jgi:NitT/TauT family transport system ATP-binding protein